MAEPLTFKKRKPCPICNRPSQLRYHPFCSDRCAQVDLNRWLGGHYAVPASDDGPSADMIGEERKPE